MGDVGVRRLEVSVEADETTSLFWRSVRPRLRLILNVAVSIGPAKETMPGAKGNGVSGDSGIVGTSMLDIN